MPPRKVTSMMENAYVELPIMAERARVQDTSYIIATNPDTARVRRTSLPDVGLTCLSHPSREARSAGRRVRVSLSVDVCCPSAIHTANNPIATLTAAIVNVVLVFQIPGLNTSAAAIVPAAAPNVLSA